MHDNGKPVDYMLQTQEEYLKYSEECAFLLGLGKLAHVCNRHYDNCKISHKQMAIFD